MSNNYNTPTKTWEVTNTIVSFTYPVEINHEYYKKRKYMIIIFYDNNKTILKKKIFFGFKGEKSRIDNETFNSKRKIR